MVSESKGEQEDSEEVVEDGEEVRERGEGRKYGKQISSFHLSAMWHFWNYNLQLPCDE